MYEPAKLMGLFKQYMEIFISKSYNQGSAYPGQFTRLADFVDLELFGRSSCCIFGRTVCCKVCRLFLCWGAHVDPYFCLFFVFERSNAKSIFWSGSENNHVTFPFMLGCHVINLSLLWSMMAAFVRPLRFRFRVPGIFLVSVFPMAERCTYAKLLL